MKGKLRITAIICIVALLLGVLAACGSEKKAPEPQETETPHDLATQEERKPLTRSQPWNCPTTK
jgi:hypothetical protein